MSSTVFTTIAISALLFSSICLERVSKSNQSIFSEAVCWICIVSTSEVYRRITTKRSRIWEGGMIGKQGLYGICFGATLLCLSYSVPGVNWSFAPLLCLAVPFVKTKPYSLLGRQDEEQKELPTTRFITRPVVYYFIFGVIAAIALTRDSLFSVLPINLCWIVAQLVLYAGLIEETQSLNGTYAQNFKEALETLSDLAMVMVCTTVPLSLLSWSSTPLGISVLGAGLLKIVYWTSILVLAHESKITIIIWTTIFTICTSALSSYQLDWRMAIILLTTFMALYNISASSPQSIYTKGITIIFALYPIWALVSHPEIKSHFTTFTSSSLNNLVTSTSPQNPVEILVNQARTNFEATLARQSRTLEEAVSGYKRRYHRAPPPGFDKWYQFAKENDVQFIDEYDMLTKSLEPFWGAEPRVLRDYVDQAINIDGANLNVLTVKGGKASLSTGSFQHKQLVELLEPVVKFLPDLKAALNEFDEPRVLIPHDQLANPLPAKSASTDTSINPMYFNMQDKQRVWESITISCPPDSNARSDTSSPTTTKPYLELPFVANLSDTQNICKWPSSASTKHGFLSSPSTFHFTHHRVPIMATARLATFHDVLMPSSYYFQSDIAAADDKKDTPWEKKKDLVYWRGTGTGGHWTKHSWKYGHRQRFVNYTNSGEQPITLLQRTASFKNWRSYTTTMSTLLSKFLVKFSNFIQCDESDCQEQIDYFHKAPTDSNDDAANYKILYNLDGNSFSGRYYRFLKSNSLVFMQALFQEWHDDRILPWVHFVPVSNDLGELPELTRFLLDEKGGKEIAERMARESKEWSRKALRKVDLSAAYFRVLIEYHRIMQDDRDSLKCC